MDIWNYLNRHYKPQDYEDGDLKYLIDRRPSTCEEMMRWYYGLNVARATAITITFKPVYQNSLSYEKMRDLVKNGLIISGCQVALYYDVDDNANFHYHGVLSGPMKKIQLIRKFFNRHIGWVKLKMISDFDRWHEYASKYSVMDKDYDFGLCINMIKK